MPGAGASSSDNKENSVRNIRATKSATSQPGSQLELQVETRTSIGARIEGGRRIEVIKAGGIFCRKCESKIGLIGERSF